MSNNRLSALSSPVGGTNAAWSSSVPAIANFANLVDNLWLGILKEFTEAISATITEIINNEFIL
jgi:hypothetical protein